MAGLTDEQVVDAIVRGGLDEQDARWIVEWAAEMFEAPAAEGDVEWIEGFAQRYLTPVTVDELKERFRYDDVETDDDGWPVDDPDWAYLVDAGLSQGAVIVEAGAPRY